MRIRHYDCYLHEQDIRLALGMAVRETVDDLASALDEVATGLGYIVGRRAALPEGTRLRIDLTGLAAPDLSGQGGRQGGGGRLPRR